MEVAVLQDSDCTPTPSVDTSRRPTKSSLPPAQETGQDWREEEEERGGLVVVVVVVVVVVDGRTVSECPSGAGLLLTHMACRLHQYPTNRVSVR
ncbi:hypothetical protein Pmani_025815 [Petrolisthes manimaculis]|uniref:Uncharacterized protein n=1 Tax=Petrolisthes manimaculis TaxID=1843537 RepID=A0AAE1P6G9_9EUCA|nr:hypothetical protein Pmani_025815 [Petrolisthes manimaculis]